MRHNTARPDLFKTNPMKLAILTEAWHPQISGVVMTLKEVRKLGQHILRVHPGLLSRTLPCPIYPQVRLAVNPSGQLHRFLNRFNPAFIHIVTEGPIGLADRFFCRKKRIVKIVLGSVFAFFSQIVMIR